LKAPKFDREVQRSVRRQFRQNHRRFARRDGGFDAKALARPVVDPVDGPPDLRIGDPVERHGLGEVVAEQAVGVLAQPVLLAVVRAREVGVAAGRLGDQGVVGELAPVVVGDGVEEAFEPFGDAAQGISGLRLGLARDAPREQRPGLVFRQRFGRPEDVAPPDPS